jgi:DNA-binding response OmpR family regulator
MIRLLHVDDETDILEIAKMSFEVHGNIDVTMCTSGGEALQAVENFTPDVFLLDYMMPELTGPETLRKLRQRPGLEEVPAVFMTARAHENEHIELWELGARDVISKPFDPMTLGKRIENAIKKAF